MATRHTRTPRLKPPGRWAELSGGYDRSAVQVESSVKHLEEFIEAARRQVNEARVAFAEGGGKASATYRAKIWVQDAHETLNKALVHARLTQATRGAELLRLPSYGDPNHIFSRARAMAERLNVLIVEAESQRRALSRGTIGEEFRQRDAIAAYDQARGAHGARGELPSTRRATPRSKKGPWPSSLRVGHLLQVRHTVAGDPPLFARTLVEVKELRKDIRRIRVEAQHGSLGNLRGSGRNYWVDPSALLLLNEALLVPDT